MDKDEALRDITTYKIAVARAQNDLRHTVAVARIAGASWSDIGAQLGISKQAAQQQYSDAKPNTYTCNCGWKMVVPLDAEACTLATNRILAHISAMHPDNTLAATRYYWACDVCDWTTSYRVEDKDAGLVEIAAHVETHTDEDYLRVNSLTD